MSEIKDLIELEDMIPVEAEFKLKATGKSYKLRKISLRDRTWIKDKFKDDIEKVFRTVDFKDLMMVIYHQLDEASKQEFLMIEREETNDDGVKVKVKVTGPELLSEALTDPEEIRDVMNAFIKTMGISQAIVDKMSAEYLKKNGQGNQ